MSGQKLGTNSDRDAKGRWVAGNRASINNTGGRPRNTWYELLDSVITDEDWVAILETAKSQAKEGDHHARAFVASHRHGLPVQRTEITGAGGADIFAEVMQAMQKASAEQE